MLEKKNFNTPDQGGTPPKAKTQIVEIGGTKVGRVEFQPGWKWSVDFAPGMGTSTCPMHHFGYIESGTLHIKMDDGQEMDVTGGDVVDIPPGHDAWVVGNEPAILVDFGGGPKEAQKEA
jgi:mannose-6-phosphate isomerase-like protein (cupin superfamily)